MAERQSERVREREGEKERWRKREGERETHTYRHRRREREREGGRETGNQHCANEMMKYGKYFWGGILQLIPGDIHVHVPQCNNPIQLKGFMSVGNNISIAKIRKLKSMN